MGSTGKHQPTAQLLGDPLPPTEFEAVYDARRTDQPWSKSNSPSLHQIQCGSAGLRRNLVDNWDEAVAEVGLATAKVWGLYMAGSAAGLRDQCRSAAPGSGRKAGRQGRRRWTAVASVVDGLIEARCYSALAGGVARRA